MGESGYQRVNAGYKIEFMQNAYRNIYKDFAQSMQLNWDEKGNK